MAFQPQPNSDTRFTGITLPYLAACIFFAMTASIAIRNRETCMLLFVFTSVPLLFLSGISWPGAAMPAFWKYFSYIFPSTFGINGYVSINSMGATLNEVSLSTKHYGYKQAFTSSPRAWYIAGRYCRAGNM